MMPSVRDKHRSGESWTAISKYCVEKVAEKTVRYLGSAAKYRVSRSPVGRILEGRGIMRFSDFHLQK